MSARTLGLALLALAVVAFAYLGMRGGERRAPAAGARETRGAELQPRATELEPPPTVPSSSSPQTTAERPALAPEAGARARSGAAASTGGLVQCVLYGKVLDGERHVARAHEGHVSLLSAAGESRYTGVSAAGDYSLAGLAPGAWTLSWGAAGYRGESAQLELGADAPIVRRDLNLQKAVVLAVWIVTPSGEPFNVALSARGKLHSQNPVRPVPIATLEAPGETIPVQDAREERYGVGSYDDYQALAVEAGTGVLVLDVDLPVFVSLVAGPHVVATQRVQPGATEVRFVLDPDALLALQAMVRARFVAAETGEPLSGVIDSENEASTVRDGVWEAVLTPGVHDFAFEAHGRARFPLHLTLEAGQELDLGELRVPSGLEIDGRLLDDAGQPVSGIIEFGTVDERGVARFDTGRSLFVGADGRFGIDGLLPAHYVLRAEPYGDIALPADGKPPLLWVAGPVPVSTLAGSATNFDLHCVKAGILELKGSHTLPTGSRCKLLDERGELQRYDAFYPGSTPRFALPPGTYTLVLCAKDWSELSRRAVVLGAGLTVVDVAR